MTKERQIQAFADGFVFLEAPRWHDERLWVSDMWDCCIWTIFPDGSKELMARAPGHLSGLGFLPDRTPLVVSMSDRKVLRIVNGRLDDYADLSAVATGDANDML